MRTSETVHSNLQEELSHLTQVFKETNAFLSSDKPKQKTFHLHLGHVYFLTAHFLVYKNEIEIEEAFSKATRLIWCSKNMFRSAHTGYTFKPRFVPLWSTCENKWFHNVLEQWQHPINTIKTIKQIHKVFRGGMSGVVQMRNTTNGDKQWRKNTTLANQHPQ